MATVQYDPSARFQVATIDVPFLRHGEKQLYVRVYRPLGAGPFPALVDVHGGAWTNGDHTTDEKVAVPLAESGLTVFSLDFRMGPAGPYPALQQDINYGIRWVKAHAAEYNADASVLGAVGWSSGGHAIVLSAMRPHDPRYAALPLPEGPQLDASLAFVAAGWPVIDPWARYEFAKARGNEGLVKNHDNYWKTPEAMQEGNPVLILQRGERVALPRLLVLQGTDDQSMPWEIVDRFAQQWRDAGGDGHCERFEGQPHGFMYEPGPNRERGLQVLREFIARCLKMPVPA